MKGAAKFAWDIDQWFRQTIDPRGGGAEWARTVLLDLVAEVVERTPVRTGRARGSWLVKLGMDTPRMRTPNDQTGDYTIFAAGRELMLMEAVGDPVQLYSWCPYIARLETGWSQQAPNGMLAGAVAAIVSKYARGRAAA